MLDIGGKIILVVLLISSSVVSGLTIETWNVGEISDPDSMRIRRLIDFAVMDKPDVLLLQEVEQVTMEQINKTKTLNNEYRRFRTGSVESFPRGGLLTFVRKELLPQHAAYSNLPSAMGRGILLVEAEVCGIRLNIANVHLESPDILFWRSHKLRLQQVERIKVISQTPENWVVAGDFNPVFEPDFDQWFSEDWRDVWVIKYPKDPGLTWDPDHNSMAWNQGGFLLPGFRLDRILLKSKQLQIHEVRRLGINSEPALSDHYGLLSELQCSN